MERVKKILPWPKIQRQPVRARFRVQVGLIDPDGFSALPTDQDFLVLSEIARHMRKKIGESNILHVFGYAHRHDRGYPDYSPSRRLGGEKFLQRAIQGVHEHKQSMTVSPRLYTRRYFATTKMLPTESPTRATVCGHGSLLGGMDKPVQSLNLHDSRNDPCQ